MDNSNIERIRQLIAKHVLGGLDESEQQELDQWRSCARANEELFKRMSDPDYLEKRYRDFEQAINGSKKKEQEAVQGIHPVWRWVALVAAAAAILLLLLVPHFTQPKIKHFFAPQKGVASLVLPDGSKVWLKASSSISYPVKFKGDTREVSFSGEGYFEVTPSDKVFVVGVDGFKIKVTGTKFDIKSYRDEKQALTALIDGEISIIYSDSTGNVKEDKMVGGDLSVFDKKLRSNTIVKTNTSIYSAWIGGVYCFESETVENILREVCRYYGYNLIISDTTVKDKILSGRLKMEDDATSIIEAFQEFLYGHIKLESDTIIIQ